MKWMHDLNVQVANSVVGKYFEINARGSTFLTELRAGLVCFLTVAYILAVNSAIIADTGGPCTDSDCCSPSPGCRFGEDECFIQCLQETRRSLITATAATSLMACFLMGAVANMPLAVCPGMGINAYFAYTVVGFLGTGKLTYQQALAACFVEGWIFILLSISGVRGYFISLVPKCIMLATAGGIGLFLAFIGLQSSEGLAVVTGDSATLVSLGGCPEKGRVRWFTPADPTYDGVCTTNPVTGEPELNLGPPSSNYQCKYDKMALPTMWLGIGGGFLIVICMAKGVKASIMWGILFTTIIAWIPGTPVSYLGEGSDRPGGESRLEYFKQVVAVPDASKTALQLEWNAFGTADLWIALITFLYLDFLDATGTLFSMASMLGQRIPGFIDPKTKAFPKQLFCFCVDGLAIVIGSLLGCAPLTVYIESASGIREGGRTGITALVVAFGFFIALFFNPLIASIPPYATGPALVLVGAMMMENLVDIDWADVRQAVPAFLTIATMPMTYSVAYGVIAGIVSYLMLYILLLCLDLVLALIFRRDIKEMLLDDYCPEIFIDRFRPDGANVPPLKSPSVVLQEHVNPEHAAHHSAVEQRWKSNDGEAAAPDAYAGSFHTSRDAAPAASNGGAPPRSGDVA